jgi:hypothetical protein
MSLPIPVSPGEKSGEQTNPKHNVYEIVPRGTFRQLFHVEQFAGPGMTSFRGAALAIIATDTVTQLQHSH